MTFPTPSSDPQASHKRRVSAMGRNPFARPKPSAAKKNRDSNLKKGSPSTIPEDTSPHLEWITDLESKAALAGLFLFCRLRL